MADSNDGGPTPPTMAEPPRVPASPYATPQAPLGREDGPTALGGGTYTLGEILSIGWAGFTAKIGIGLGIAVLFIIIHGIASNIPVLNLVYLIAAQFPFQAGLALVGAKLADAGMGRDVTLEVGDLFSGFTRYLSTLGAGWLMLVMFIVPLVIVGAVLFAIVEGVGLRGDAGPAVIGLGLFVAALPILYVMLRLAFVYYLILDQGMTAIDSFKESWSLTNGHVLNLFVLGLVAGAAMLAGTLLLLVGIVPAAVFIWSMFGAAYRKISNT